MPANRGYLPVALGLSRLVGATLAAQRVGRQFRAWAIVKKGKRIENWTWSTKYRGDLFERRSVVRG